MAVWVAQAVVSQKLKNDKVGKLKTSIRLSHVYSLCV